MSRSLAELRGWNIELTLERPVEGRFGAITHCSRDFRDAVICRQKQFGAITHGTHLFEG